MNHFDTPTVTGMALGIPVSITTARAGRWLLPGSGQDHLFVADCVPLSIGRNRQRVAELLAFRIAIAIGIAIGELVCRVALRTSSCFRCKVETCAAGDTTKERVDHRDVANDDSDKGFATGPAARFLGTASTGLGEKR